MRKVKFDLDRLTSIILNEERGISSEVQEFANGIFKEIQYEIENIDVDYDKSPYLANYYEFDVEFDEKPFVLGLYVHFFKDLETYNKFKFNVEYRYKYINNAKKLLLTVEVIGHNVIYTTSMTKLVHELMHKLQYDKTNKTLLHKEKYYRNINDISSNNDSIDNAIKTIIYLSSPYEQASYANELYSELMFRNNPRYEEVINSCNSYLAFKSLENSVKIIEQHRIDDNFIIKLSNYGYSADNFIKQAKISLKKFANKIGKAISLFLDNAPYKKYNT